MRQKHSERGSRFRRVLDRLVGCCLIALLSLVRRRRSPPTHVNSIGLIMFGAIGDTLLASAIVHDLRAGFPGARTLAFVSNSNRSTLELLDGFDEVVVVPIMSPFSAIQLIRRYSLDILIDTSQWPRIGALLACLAQSQFVVGFRTAGQSRHMAFDAYVEHSGQLHEIDNFRSLLSPLNLAAHSLPRFKPALLTDISSRPSRNAYVIFHPWASGYRSELREWELSRWVQLGQQLLEWGYEIVITGGPEDQRRSKSLAAALGQSARVEVLAGRVSLRETAVVIARASGVVSVNTGVMHLSALFNVPMVALHGPTNSHRWGPLSNAAVVVGPGPECGCGFLNLGFEYPSAPPACMDLISVEDVMQPLRALLKRSSAVGL